ncbi:hypothetical protein PGT21_015182 [Puccinia graminis f. sp. tritici]|uniref:Uncharacterized protein n=1 Tax=Puccinia graminis f. sp. tritici TaxID=56615 RepID=A0A5B0MEX9_PUCGR|nr:hypothetical protein PGT21_015182 [Puccinia graminis f. sp. tritici]
MLSFPKLRTESIRSVLATNSTSTLSTLLICLQTAAAAATSQNLDTCKNRHHSPSSSNNPQPTTHTNDTQPLAPTTTPITDPDYPNHSFIYSVCLELILKLQTPERLF